MICKFPISSTKPCGIMLNLKRPNPGPKLGDAAFLLKLQSLIPVMSLSEIHVGGDR